MPGYCNLYASTAGSAGARLLCGRDGGSMLVLAAPGGRGGALWEGGYDVRSGGRLGI